MMFFENDSTEAPSFTLTNLKSLSSCLDLICPACIKHTLPTSMTSLTLWTMENPFSDFKNWSKPLTRIASNLTSLSLVDNYGNFNIPKIPLSSNLQHLRTSVSGKFLLSLLRSIPRRLKSLELCNDDSMGEMCEVLSTNKVEMDTVYAPELLILYGLPRHGPSDLEQWRLTDGKKLEQWCEDRAAKLDLRVIVADYVDPDWSPQIVS